MKISIPLFIVAFCTQLHAQQSVTGKLVGVQSDVYPNKCFTLLVEDENYRHSHLALKKQVTINGQNLLLYTVAELEAYFEKHDGEEPTPVANTRLFGQTYVFTYTGSTDKAVCTGIAPYVSPAGAVAPERKRDVSFFRDIGSGERFWSFKRPIFNLPMQFALYNDIKLSGSTEGFDVKRIETAMWEAVNNSILLHPTTYFEWEAAKDTLKNAIRFTINSVSSHYKSGSYPMPMVGVVNYAGYKVTIKYTLQLFSGLSRTSKTLTGTASGGSQVGNDDKDKAFSKALAELKGQIQTQLMVSYPAYSDKIQIHEIKSNGRDTKSVLLFYANEAMMAGVNYGVLFFTDNDYYLTPEGEVSFRSLLGKGKVMEVIGYNKSIKVKISEGDDRIKPVLDSGMKIHALILPLRIVDNFKM